jgi:hypothetical protein
VLFFPLFFFFPHENPYRHFSFSDAHYMPWPSHRNSRPALSSNIRTATI